MTDNLIAKALRGCKQSASALVESQTELNDKVACVQILCRRKVPRDVVRHVLLKAIREHPRCIQPEVAGSRALLRELFDYAAYPVPVKGDITLYRGFAGEDRDKATGGYFWTNDRSWAIYYALLRSWRASSLYPVVLSSIVNAKDIAVITDTLKCLDKPEIGAEFIVLKVQHRTIAQRVTVAEARCMVDLHEQKLGPHVSAGDFPQEIADMAIDNTRVWLENYERLIASYRDRPAWARPLYFNG